MKFILINTLVIPLLFVFVKAPICSGQESGADTTAKQSDTEKFSEPVELTYGMSRNLVIKDLGNPEFESIIHSLRRARVVYSDDTVLVFDRDSLVLVQTVIPPKTSDEGFAMAKGADKELKIDTRLLEGRPQLAEPEVEHRFVREQAFFYAPNTSVIMNDGIHFSPVVNTCLFGPACGTIVDGRCAACRQNACPHNAWKASGPSDSIRRLMHCIKRDVCHVSP